MAIVQISRIQQRRGLNQDLPQLASAELAWSVDTRQLYIGNGTLAEGAPTEGVTEILTEYSIINFTDQFTSDFANLQANVATIYAEVTAAGGIKSNVVLAANTAGIFSTITANNATVNYTLYQGTTQRTGTIKLSRFATGSSLAFEEDYNQTAGTDIFFTANANTTQANLNYTTTSQTTVAYSITNV